MDDEAMSETKEVHGEASTAFRHSGVETAA